MIATSLKRNCLFMALAAFTISAIAYRSQEGGSSAASAPRVAPVPATQAPFDVEAVIRQVHFAYQPEQDGWRGGHSTYDVKATAQGLTLTPIHYKNAEPEAPEPPEALTRPSAPSVPEVEKGASLFLGAAQVARGDTRLSVDAPRGKVETDGHLLFQHGALVEHLRNSEQGVEQSWSFDTLPAGHGALRVTVPVKGLVHTGTSEQGISFADARTGSGVRYGHGTWVDAKGRRTSVPAEYVHGEIQLRVPEEVLTASAYPAVLDPMIWTEMVIDGRLVAADLNVRDQPVLAFNGTNYLVVWRDRRSGLYDLYGARVSSTGTVLDTSGFMLSTGTANLFDPQVASNGTDFYVAWNQLEATYRIRGTIVSSAGVVADPGGKRISALDRAQRWPHVASNGTDYLVVWYMNDLDGYDNVYARRVSSTGQLMDTADIPIATGQNYDEQTATVASNGTVYLVAWTDWRMGTGSGGINSRAYATRVANDGTVLDGTGFPLSGNFPQANPAVASNGTDFFAAWLDYRNTTYRDLYGARVTSSGTVVDTSGLALATTPSIAEVFPTAASNGTDYFVAWTSWDTTNSTYQTLGARVSASASASSAVLDTTSLVLSPIASHKHPSVARAGSGYLVAWDGTSSGTTDLYNAWVSSSGTTTSGSGFPITGSTLSQVEPVVASNGTNYLVVWREVTPNSNKIYGARVASLGGVLDSPPLQITSTASQERQEPAVASNGTDYFVTWMDYRNSNWDIYGARVLGTGASASALLDTNGFAISTHSAFENAPAVASDGTNYFVTWRRDPGGQGDIYGARVTSAGVVQDTTAIAIATNSAQHYPPRIAFNGTNYLVVWPEYLSATNFDVHGARVTTSGSVLDNPSIAITSASGDQYEPDVASNGTDFLVVWTNGADIAGARVSGAGSVVDTTPLSLCTNTANQFAPRVIFNGTSYLAAWADYRDADSYWDIYGVDVSSSGTLGAPYRSPDFSIAENIRQSEPFFAMASLGGPEHFVLYSKYDTEPSTGSRRIRGQIFPLYY